MSRTMGATRNCAGCRFWSEMVAQAIEGRGVEALCLEGANSPEAGKYTAGADSCFFWKSGHHGAVDEPDPEGYGVQTRAAYAAEESEA